MKLHLVNDQARSADRPKLGLGYISSYLKKYCDDIEISVSFLGDDTIGMIKSLKPDIVGLTATTETFNNTVSIARDIKESLGMPLLIGGTHITILPQHLPEWIDAGVIGEGEETIREIISSFRKYGTVAHENLNGIVFMDGQHLIRTDERKLIDPLDSIPFPDWDMLGLSNTGPGHIITSRGCTYKCVFCASAAIWKKIRFFSPEYVVNEIKTIVEKFGRQEILIYDDLFTANSKRVRRISELICQEGLDRSVRFECLSNVNHFSQETAQDLKKMNVHRISFGMESGSPKMLTYLKKGTVTTEKIRSAVKAGVDNGLEVLGSFMIGTPGETEDDMKMTYDFIKGLGLTEVGINVATPFPGTDLWNYAVENNYIKDAWDDSIYAMKTITPETIKDKQLLCSVEKDRFIEIYKKLIDLDSMLIDRRIRVRTLRDIVLNTFGKDMTRSSTCKVLDVSCEDGALGAAIKSRIYAEVTGMNPDLHYAADCERRLDSVIRGDLNEVGVKYAGGYFDVILFNELMPDHETFKHYNALLKPEGVIAGTFANRMHFSYLAYSVLGINRPLFETTDGTLQYMKWGMPEKDRFPGNVLKDLESFLKKEDYSISIYEFKGLDNIFSQELLHYLGSYLSHPDEFYYESKVIRYFFMAENKTVSPEFHKEDKAMVRHDENCVQDSRSGSIKMKKDNKESIENLASLVPDQAKKIMHPGCGDGELGKELLARGAETVIGIERDTSKCEKARSSITEVICGDIEEADLQYDSGYFDCIICDGILEYLKDPLHILKKLKDCLSDTGTIVAVIANTGTIHHINKLIDGQWNSDHIDGPDGIPLRFYTRKEIENLFDASGFELTGLSPGAMHPEYHEVDATASHNATAGRVSLKGLTPEELRDMYTVNYLIRAGKKGVELEILTRHVNSLLHDEKIKEAEQAVQKYLEVHLADTNALLLHADICVMQDLYEKALESINKVLLFEPERQDAIELKSRIQKSGVVA